MSTRRILGHIVLVIAYLSSSYGALYDYGGTNADALPKTDDAYSPEIVLNQGFPFYEHVYWHLYVNENGLISFEHEVGAYSDMPNFFPQGPALDGPDSGSEPDERIIIAPFWADIDTRSIGSVYYRQDQSEATLNQITADIRKYYVMARDFTATWSFVATWAGVTFKGYNTENPDIPKNTFQTVLATDGYRSYILFIYDDITWTSSTDMGGKADTGTGGTPALIGLNAGDGYRQFTAYDYSRKDTQTTLDVVTNCDETGRFVYDVSTVDIKEGGCKQTPSSVYPPYISMMGGNKLYIVGQCWTPTEINCTFERDGVILQVARVVYVNPSEAYCVPNPFFVTGEVLVTIPALTIAFKAKVVIVEYERFAAINDYDVTLVNSNDKKWRNSGKELTIEWVTDYFGATDAIVAADVIAYREDGENPEWETVYTITPMTSNDGSFSFVPSAMANVTADNAFGIIRVRGSSSDPILYSKIHALGYLLEDSYQDRSFNWSQNACVNWYEADQTTPDYIANLPSCPCTLDQALGDGSRFQPDTGCSLFQRSVCTYHKGAKHCVRSIFPTTDNSGVQCCYTEEGDLMYAGDSFNGSTADRSHPWGVAPYGTKGKVPAMSHWVDDVISFYYCCIWTDNSDDCWNYMERRPTADCRNYVPPTHATMYGDPHVYTFDGLGYTANLKGEFVLLQSIDSDALQIQGRMEQISNYNGQIQLATGLTAIAMQDLSTDIVQVKLDPISMLIISHGSDKVAVKNQKLINFKGVTAVFNADFTGGNITKVSFIFDSGIAVQVNAIPQLMSLSITIPPTLTEKVSGFFGDANNLTSDDPFGDDELFTDEQNLFAYANANMEIEAKDSLFKYELGKSHSDYQNASFRPLFEDPPGTNIPSNTLNLMPETCEGISSCEYDVLTTGLLDVGEATRQAVYQYFLNRNRSLAVLACPYIRTPLNGKKGFVGGQNNHLVGATITFYCNDGYILSGSTTRNCKNNGEWTGTTSEPICYYARECGSLEPPENGYITVDMSGDEIVAEFTCNDGYNLGGSSVRTCSSDVWTGETTGCYDGLTPDQQLALILGLVIPIVFIVAVVIAFILYRKRKRERDIYGGTSGGTSAATPMKNTAKAEEYKDEPTKHVPSAANI